MREKETRDGYLMLGPWILGFLVLVLGPILASLVMSFTNWQLVGSVQWVGVQNYVTMLFHDPLIWVSFWNTAYYALISTPLYACVGLGLSLLLRRKLKGLRIFRTAYFLPSIVPVVASTLLWMLVFEPNFGLADALLRVVHLPQQMWLSSPIEAKPVLILMYVWGAGGSIPIFLAGLNAIPDELYEAAAMDGGSQWQVFQKVTLPLVSPVLFFILVTGFIAGFQVFTPAYVATGGSGEPLNSTMFFGLDLYNNAFRYLHMGYASAMAWLLFVVVLGFTVFQFAIARRFVFYESSPDK